MSEYSNISVEELFVQAVAEKPKARPEVCALVRLRSNPTEIYLWKVAARYGFDASTADGIMDGWDLAAGIGGDTFANAFAVLAKPEAYKDGLEIGVKAYNTCFNSGKIA